MVFTLLEVFLRHRRPVYFLFLLIVGLRPTPTKGTQSIGVANATLLPFAEGEQERKKGCTINMVAISDTAKVVLVILIVIVFAVLTYFLIAWTQRKYYCVTATATTSQKSAPTTSACEQRFSAPTPGSPAYDSLVQCRSKCAIVPPAPPSPSKWYCASNSNRGQQGSSTATTKKKKNCVYSSTPTFLNARPFATQSACEKGRTCSVKGGGGSDSDSSASDSDNDSGPGWYTISGTSKLCDKYQKKPRVGATRHASFESCWDAMHPSCARSAPSEEEREQDVSDNFNLVSSTQKHDLRMSYGVSSMPVNL